MPKRSRFIFVGKLLNSSSAKKIGLLYCRGVANSPRGQVSYFCFYKTFQWFGLTIVRPTM